jgi:hypothetical protein
MTDTSDVLDEQYKSPLTMNGSTPGAGTRNSRSTACITPRFGLLFTPFWAALSSSTKTAVVRMQLAV